MDVVIYTDKPDRYRDLPVRIVELTTSKINDFSRGGLYHHRIKPCVLLEEMKGNPNFCVMTDTDTFFQDGFFEKLRSMVYAGSVAVDRFHGRNPFPALTGFAADLPNAGLYHYDTQVSVEFNSGLTAVDPAKHRPVIEDSIALIDAVLDQGKKLLTLEQIALSESLRVHRIPVTTMYPLFRHYYRVAHKRYMQWHIRRWHDEQNGVFVPQAPTIRYTRPRVRFFRIWARLELDAGFPPPKGAGRYEVAVTAEGATRFRPSENRLGIRGTPSPSGLLQIGQGAPAPPQMHACGPVQD
ncbi:hypothetical protein [Bradyrhizobium sp. BR 1433]|uniref:hypothetical protein n=1 Tax=Bradyrhizobium sp. BR 1433 TaxID=3447967 RepID=UPI003EE52230